MSNILDMRRRKIETIDEMVNEIHRQFDSALTSDKKSYSSRIYAGRLLNELQERIESGEEGEGIKWWKWCKGHIVRSRKDCMKVMALAKADDPEAAAEEAKAKNKEEAKRSRERRQVADVSDQSEVEEKPNEQGKMLATILRLVAQLDADHLQMMFAEIRSHYGYQD